MTDNDLSFDDPPRTTNIADTIFEDLRAQILKGNLKAGQRLMGERELATRYGTNRNTLREAVRKLEQANLVSVRHGRGVIVSDFRRTGTLELLSPYLQSGPELRELVDMLEDILVPRVFLIEYATRLAARRAEPSDVQRITELTELLITAFEAKDAKVVAKGFHRWLDAVVDASHSTPVRWTANPFLQALRSLLERLPMLWILEPSFPAHLRAVAAAIESGDEDGAARATTDYYQRVDSQLLALMRRALPGVMRTPVAPSPAQGVQPTPTSPPESAPGDASADGAPARDFES